MPKSIPQLGDSNWGTPLNAHISQLQNPANGAINSFEQFSGRPINLTLDDAGKTYLYTQTGNIHQWTGNSWKVLNESVINVKDYGAVGDGVTDDSDKIQYCLDNFVGKTIFLPNGIFIITKPLILPSNTVLRGSSTLGTNIKKTTGTADANGIKAVIVMKSKASPLEYNSDSTISDLYILGDYAEDGILKKTDYGIYADKCSTFKLDKVSILNCNTGFYSSDCFLAFFSNINIFEGTFGITITNGTSLTANTVYCINCNVGYNFKNLRYSTLNSCACDGANYINYFFEVCQGMTLNSCGAENGSNGYAIFVLDSSNVIINAPFIIAGGTYEKGIFYTQNKSQVLLNNPTLRSNASNKFITAETNSLVTLDELYNTASDLVSREAYNKADKFVELSGGIINTPTKDSAISKYKKLIQSQIYDANFPSGNNNYNENLNLNLNSEITRLVGSSWEKASITFHGNDGTSNVGYVVIQAFNTVGGKSFILTTGNGGATLSAGILKIPTIAAAGGGYWFQMNGIYEMTIST
jgi:hypothetical protein